MSNQEAIHILHCWRLTDKDMPLVHAIEQAFDTKVVWATRQATPKVNFPTGKGATWDLAWIVFTFLGSGGALIFKSFLDSVGKELGKKLVDHCTKKNEERRNENGKT